MQAGDIKKVKNTHINLIKKFISTFLSEAVKDFFQSWLFNQHAIITVCKDVWPRRLKYNFRDITSPCWLILEDEPSGAVTTSL